MIHRPIHIPFDGDPPAVKAGDPVACTAADGHEHHMYALGPARYDDAMSIGGKCYLTVPVAFPMAWLMYGTNQKGRNWPAEAVKKVAA